MFLFVYWLFVDCGKTIFFSCNFSSEMPAALPVVRLSRAICVWRDRIASGSQRARAAHVEYVSSSVSCNCFRFCHRSRTPAVIYTSPCRRTGSSIQSLNDKCGAINDRMRDRTDASLPINISLRFFCCSSLVSPSAA